MQISSARSVLILLLSAVVTLVAQTCPSYTHKDDVTIGDVADLPDGWYVFTIQGRKGIFTSPIKTFDPRVIPNTDTDSGYPTAVDVSEDGTWIFYISLLTEITVEQDGTKKFQTLGTEGAYVIQRNGRGKTSLEIARTNSQGDENWPMAGGFWRNSPRGSEVWYIQNSARMYAKQITFEQDTAHDEPGFGRLVYNLPENAWQDVLLNYLWYVKGSRHALWGDQHMGGMIMGKWPGQTSHMVIPDNGMGEINATNFSQQMYPWQYGGDDKIGGCGHTVSYDGALWLANPHLFGDPECTPNHATNEDNSHRGFYITRFRRVGEDTVTFHSHVDIEGISINWCPTEYRKGSSWTYMDFDHWAFTNENRYVAGAVNGPGLAENNLPTALWIVDWRNSVWTPITADTCTEPMEHPRAWFPAGQSIRHGRAVPRVPGTTRSFSARVPVGASTVTVPAGIRMVSLHTIDGRQVWEYVRSDVSAGEISVVMPASISRGACLFARYAER